MPASQSLGDKWGDAYELLRGEFAHWMCSVNLSNSSYYLKKSFMASLIEDIQRKLHSYTFLQPVVPVVPVETFPWGEARRDELPHWRLGANGFSGAGDGIQYLLVKGWWPQCIENGTAPFRNCDFQGECDSCECVPHTHIHNMDTSNLFSVIEPCVQNSSVHTNHPEILLKCKSNSVGLGWRLGVCISNKLLMNPKWNHS